MFNLIVLGMWNIDDHLIIGSLRNIRSSVCDAPSKSNFTKTDILVSIYEQ